MPSWPTPPRGSAHRVRSPSTLPQSNPGLGWLAGTIGTFYCYIAIIPFSSSSYPSVSSYPHYLSSLIPSHPPKQDNLCDDSGFGRCSPRRSPTSLSRSCSCPFYPTSRQVHYPWLQSDVSTAVNLSRSSLVRCHARYGTR